MIRSIQWLEMIVLLTAALACNQTMAAMPTTVKMDRQLRAIAESAATGHVIAEMQAALTRQLFRENAPFDARWNAQGQVQIYIYYDRNHVTPDAAGLMQLGATNIHVTPLMGVVEGWVPASKLATVAGLPWVRRVSVPQYLIPNSYPPSMTPQPRTGSVDSQGDQILGAAAFRQATGDSGQNVSVGVISSGAAGISQSQATGDLPSGVWVDPTYTGSSTDGEGTAMLEIVHDLAPGAGLAFCGPNTSAEFMNCLSDLQTHGAQVIVDDLTIPVTAYFTNDSDVTAVQQWQQQHSDTRLVTAAGNFALSFWSGTWNPASITPVNINNVTYAEVQNFGTSAAPNYYEQITVAPSAGVEYILECDDPWVPSAEITSSTPNDPNDYDVVLYDSNNNIIACTQGETYDQNGCAQAGAASSATPGPQPVTGNLWTNTSTSSVEVNLAIYLRAGQPGNQLKLFVASPNSCEVTISTVNPIGSIVGHAALPYPAEISVGALNASAALQNQYDVEAYSSQGPVSLPLLTSSPIPKPDFVGVDGVSISGAGGFPPAECGQPAPNPPVFYGTSAAAPHVAALIALLESAGYSSDQAYGVLQSNSKGLTFNTPNGSGIPNGVSGYGLPDIASVKTVSNSASASNGKSGGGGSLGILSLMLLLIGIRLKQRQQA
ncbi:MAG: hypothetical protein WCC11_06715 [Gammaproteobacteria bacterium]